MPIKDTSGNRPSSIQHYATGIHCDIGHSYHNQRTPEGPTTEISQPEYGTSNTQFWDIIRRADASFHRQDRASLRFHEVKRRVDQTLRCVRGDEDTQPQHDLGDFADSQHREVQDLDLLDESIVPYEEQNMRHSHDIVMIASGGDISSLQDERSSKDYTESTRQGEQAREAHEQIAPIIDAMESRAARVEQLVEEMELLLTDIQRWLDTTGHQCSSSGGSPI